VTPRERLGDARLYLVCDARPGEFLHAALRGGVDLVQLRDKTLDDDGLIAAAEVFRSAADSHGALFILNDRPDLVGACRADGVHVGQDDSTPGAARAVVGPDLIVGRSTHAPAQADAADADPEVDYLAVGPVHATPTKPGRPAAGLDYVTYAAGSVTKPWFAIGGLNLGNVAEAVERGARRIVVVRALTEARRGAAGDEAQAEAVVAGDDAQAEAVEAAARALRQALEAPVGSAQP
jgi:thiamine-phosphate pyrophosphorylase